MQFTNGIHIDHAHNRLLVSTTYADAILDCEVAHEESHFVGLAIYDLETLERIDLIDLTDMYPNYGSMTNDVTVGDEGNIYATDCCGSRVTMIDTVGNISSVITGDLFYISAVPLGVGAFNGID